MDALQRLAGLAKQLTNARYGAVVVIDERDGGNPFREADEVFLQVLARHAGRVIGGSWH